MRSPHPIAAILLIVICSSAPAEDKVSIVRVRVPEFDAVLRVGPAVTKQYGLDRTFQTPPLNTGKTYQYTFTVVFEPNNYTTITRQRRVSFQGGEVISLDMRERDPEVEDEIVIRYVPTPSRVVDEMLKLAQVKEGDVVYDLGCGDGRIVIRAVEAFDAQRGVGVDIDPKRVAEAKRRAEKIGVAKKVEIRQADVLKLDDISEATVVALYMGEELNLQLRPLLQKSLKPGSRIVSHRFSMGDWKPTKSITVLEPDDTPYRLHLWMIDE